MFTIAPATGVITTLQPLDYESAKQHNFTIEVTDGGAAPRKGRALVIVNVRDLEDSEPLFESREYNAEFEENKVGEVIQVKVSFYYLA